jgi:hypothetical protein
MFWRALLVMTTDEYEERFRLQAPSLHQIFVEIETPHRELRRKRVFVIAAGLLGVTIVLLETASHLPRR